MLGAEAVHHSREDYVGAQSITGVYGLVFICDLRGKRGIYGRVSHGKLRNRKGNYLRAAEVSARSLYRYSRQISGVIERINVVVIAVVGIVEAAVNIVGMYSVRSSAYAEIDVFECRSDRVPRISERFSVYRRTGHRSGRQNDGRNSERFVIKSQTVTRTVAGSRQKYAEKEGIRSRVAGHGNAFIAVPGNSFPVIIIAAVLYVAVAGNAVSAAVHYEGSAYVAVRLTLLTYGLRTGSLRYRRRKPVRVQQKTVPVQLLQIRIISVRSGRTRIRNIYLIEVRREHNDVAPSVTRLVQIRAGGKIYRLGHIVGNVADISAAHSPAAEEISVLYRDRHVIEIRAARIRRGGAVIRFIRLVHVIAADSAARGALSAVSKPYLR